MAVPAHRPTANGRPFPDHLHPSVAIEVDGPGSLDDLRPGDTVGLRVDADNAAEVEIRFTGPSAAAFHAGQSARTRRSDVTITAVAPGLARLAVVLRGRRLLDLRLVCRGPSDDLAARCQRAAAIHQDRLRRIDDHVTRLADVVIQVRTAVATRLRARDPAAAILRPDHEAALVLGQRSRAVGPVAVGFLPDVWSRVVQAGVATRALAVLAPHEPSPPRDVAAAAPTSIEDVRDRILAATRQEARLVAELLAAWSRWPSASTVRAPDLELAAGLGAEVPAPPDAAVVARAYWRAWALEHGLEITSTPAGPRVRWTLDRGLFAELSSAFSAGWVAAVRAEVAAIASAAEAVEVL
jgi:hypothetical protein